MSRHQPGFIECVYGSAVSRKQISAWVDVVFDTARTDPVAQTILNGASMELAELVTTLAEQLNFPATDFALGVAGGILLNQPEFLSQVIAGIGVRVDRVVSVPCPAAGAVTIAERLACQ